VYTSEYVCIINIMCIYVCVYVYICMCICPMGEIYKYLSLLCVCEIYFLGCVYP
jgi:hypothetical protein